MDISIPVMDIIDKITNYAERTVAAEYNTECLREQLLRADAKILSLLKQIKMSEKIESVKVEKVEPVKIEPVKIEPEKVEPEKVEPEKVEPVKIEPEKVEPVKKKRKSRAKKPVVEKVEPVVVEPKTIVDEHVIPPACQELIDLTKDGLIKISFLAEQCKVPKEEIMARAQLLTHTYGKTVDMKDDMIRILTPEEAAEAAFDKAAEEKTKKTLMKEPTKVAETKNPDEYDDFLS